MQTGYDIRQWAMDKALEFSRGRNLQSVADLIKEAEEILAFAQQAPATPIKQAA